MCRLQSKALRLACFTFLFCAQLFIPVAVTAQSARERLAETLDGRLIDPIESSGARTTVLLFVRTDCPISNRYAPEIQRLSRQFRGVANFWMVYPDKSESATKIRKHLEDFHYSVPALRDTHHSLVAGAQVTITPEAAVFDKTGKLTYHGRIDNWYEDFGRSRQMPTTHELESAIRDALNGKATLPAYVNAVGCYISDLK
jgi:hypothetical protein